jgi:superfamily II DNA helicase RecQ
LNEFFQAFEQAQEEDNSNNQRRRCEPNPWLEHTMWERHIGPYKKWAVRMTRENVTKEDIDGKEKQPTGEANEEDGEPVGEATGWGEPVGEATGWGEPNSEASEEINAAFVESEEALEQACKATQWLIRRAYQVSRVDIVGRPAMEYVNRRETGAPDSNRPFYGKQKVQTIRKYSSHFVRVLRYIWRTEDITRRPEYCLTSTQEEVLVELRRQASIVARKERGLQQSNSSQSTAKRDRQKQRRGRLVNQCSSFWIAMFDHPLGDREYESAILSGLAVLGADGENGGWMPAINYTPILAAMITTMRAIVIRRGWRKRQDQIQKKIQSRIPEKQAHKEACNVVDTVKEDVHKFMTTTQFGGQATPMNRIYVHKMYGMKIRYTTKAEGQISWEGEDTVLVRKIKFSMNDIRSIVHGLLAVVRTQLIQELLIMNEEPNTINWRPEELPKFDISNISDNHRVLDEGWNFFKDVRNEWAVNGERWMGMRLFEDGRVREQFIRSQEGTSVECQPDAVNRYLRAVKKFKERLIVLVHMSAGAPARSTELTSIQCENGKYARSQRGVFIDNGLVAFVTAYHKGFSASQSMKIIHRFVPREVGEIVIYYMWLIRPFERILQRMNSGQMLFSSWFWEPEPEEQSMEEDPDEADDQYEGYASDHEEEEVHEGRMDGWEDVEQDEIAAVSQHSTPSPESRNCDGYWDTNRVRRVMRRETANLCGVAIGISDWRQVYPAIHRQFSMDQRIQETLTKIYENRNPNAHESEPSAGSNQMEVARARQAGHSPQMEEDIYGRLLEQSPFTTVAEQDAYRQVSVDWHRFLQFPSSFEADSVDPDIRRRVKKEEDEARFHRFQGMRNIDVQEELRHMYHDPDATFRGAQQEAVNLIVRGVPRVVIIMRTGGGKSLLFMLPAAASKGGVTIVVVPKIALQANMKKRCRDAGIKCAVWSDNRAPPYDAKIVFVVAESAVTQSFADFINAKKGSHQLERIVIDECHSVLQSDEKWRPKMLQLRELAGRDTQVVCLTATLPPKKEDEFLERMDMKVDGLQILRDITVRPNIAYIVEEYDEEDEVEFLRELVEQKKAQYPRSDKIVIYCRTKEQVRHFAEELKCTPFWRDVGSEQEKEEILEKLTDGEERVFTSTNALGEGIDAPGIRVVIHVGMVDSLDDYGQQSGRAGRDGHTASEAIILRKVRTGKDGRRRPEQGWKTEPEMKEFYAGKKCKRVIMDQYMDGDTQRTSCRPGEQFCDVCRGRGAKRVRVVDEQEGPASKRVWRSPVRQMDRPESGDECIEVAHVRKSTLEGERGAKEHAEQHAEQEGRQQYERERRQYAAIETQQRERRIERSYFADAIEEIFREWKHGCSICRVRYRPSNTGHRWRTCPHENVDIQAIEDSKTWLRKVAWSGGRICGGCWAPQAICHSWEPIDNTGRMAFRKGEQPCQFQGVLQEAVAVMWSASPDHTHAAIKEWIEEQIRSAEAHQAGGEEAINVEEDAIVHGWLGSPVLKNGVSMSGMCWLFCQWAPASIDRE